MKVIVSIIIVNYNGKHLMRQILSSIKKSTFKNYEIIVVDNCSSDGSVDFLKKYFKSVKLVCNKENLGYVGINSGIKYCKGKYILFLNNDLELDKNCIKNLVKTLDSDESIAMAAPKLINFYERRFESGGTWISKSFYNGHIKDKETKEKEIPYLGVGMIKKDLIGIFGYLFDPLYFIYAEDIDLGLRIRLCGKKVMFNPNSIIYHMHSATSQQIQKNFTTFLMERNLLITLFKVVSVKNIIFLFSYIFLMRISAVLRDIIAGKFSIGFARIGAMAWIFQNLSLISEKRRETQRFRKVNDRFIFKVFTEKYVFRKKFIV